MYIRQRHTRYAYGIGQFRFRLTVIIGRSVRFQFRSFRILLLVITKITYQQVHRSSRFKLYCRTFLALHIPVHSISSQPFQLSGQRIYLPGTLENRLAPVASFTGVSPFRIFTFAADKGFISAALSVTLPAALSFSNCKFALKLASSFS